MIKPKHIKKKVKGDYRCIVVSDIHGHLDRFKSLLQKVKYTSEDYLIILGDFVEKGDQVLETIEFIRYLDQNEKTFVLAGNCEWALTALLEIPELACEIPKYFQRVSANGAIRTVYHRLHLDDGTESTLGVQKRIADYLKDELKYLSSLPVTLKFNDFIFVHAGLERRKDYQNCSMSSLLEMQDFLNKGHILDEIVIVGHLPTSNYHKHYIENDIIIDEDRKIICIDGGTGVKQISQMNALIIESHLGEVTFKKEFVQPLPKVKVKKDILVEEKEINKIAFPHFEVEILQAGQEFSICKQKATGKVFDIKNEFIYQRNNITYCLDDYTNARLSIKKNSVVKLIGIYSDYAYVVHHNKVGWVKTKDLCMDEYL